jgi:hypothetical protein
MRIPYTIRKIPITHCIIAGKKRTIIPARIARIPITILFMTSSSFRRLMAS